MLKVTKIVAHYSGHQIDFEYTTYFPNGLVDEEEGVPSVLVLTDKGGFNVNFAKDNYEFNFSNILDILNKDTFYSIANDEIELLDTSGISGELLLNGEIIEKEGQLEVINYSKEIKNDWEKIGERDAWEVVVKSSLKPSIQIFFEDNTVNEYSKIDEAITFIKSLNLD